MIPQSLPWYVARSAGLISWALLTASVLWGLALSSKALGKRPRPNWLLDLHRFLGGLATIFVGVHVGAILLDTFVHFDLTEIFVPFTATWKPTAVAWGIVGMYLLVAIELTSLLKKRLPKKIWRAVHFASFPLFAFATIHALTAGTDTGAWLFEAAAATSTLAIVGLTVLRIRQAQQPKPSRVPAGARAAYAGADAVPAAAPTPTDRGGLDRELVAPARRL